MYQELRNSLKKCNQHNNYESNDSGKWKMNKYKFDVE